MTRMWMDIFGQLELERVLNVSVPSRGRFGMTISSLADLNGDGLRDVAVGAPMEDNNRGAVYIYLGNRDTGIRPAFSQVSTHNRVTGSNILSVRLFDVYDRLTQIQSLLKKSFYISIRQYLVKSRFIKIRMKKHHCTVVIQGLGETLVSSSWVFFTQKQFNMADM